MRNKGKSKTFILCFDSAGEGIPVLIIGRKVKNKENEIVNAFSGEKATALYEALMEGKEKYETTEAINP